MITNFGDGGAGACLAVGGMVGLFLNGSMHSPFVWLHWTKLLSVYVTPLSGDISITIWQEKYIWIIDISQFSLLQTLLGGNSQYTWEPAGVCLFCGFLTSLESYFEWSIIEIGVETTDKRGEVCWFEASIIDIIMAYTDIACHSQTRMSCWWCWWGWIRWE